MLSGASNAGEGIQRFTAHGTTAGGVPFILDSSFVNLLKLLPGSSRFLPIRVRLLRRDLTSFVFTVS
jgi:hypothetical protein